MNDSCVLADRLDAFLDGDLAPEESSAFETHLIACASCTDELTMARRLLAELRALPAEPCPDAVLDAALARIARLEQDRPALDGTARERAPRWRFVRVGVALFALLAATVAMLRFEREAAEGPLVANDTPAGAPVPAVKEPPVQEAPVEPVEAVPVQATPAPAPGPRDRPHRTAPVVSSPPEDVLAAEDTPDGSASPTEAGPSEAEAAREGALLAFALVADVQRDAREAVRDGVGGELGLITDALSFALPD